MKGNRPVAIAISDLHLTLHPPAARGEGMDEWRKVQRKYLWLVDKLASKYEIPVLIAGDIFDRWNTPPELINMAIDILPRWCITVPGQHDLPFHLKTAVERSGYGVLSKITRIKDISGGKEVNPFPGVVIKGFGWGEEITPPERKGKLNILLAHRYVWIEGKSYPGADEKCHLSRVENLHHYQVAVFGDNHKNFITKRGGTIVVNCGTFIRRRRDEIDCTPGIAVIFENGEVKRKKFDTSQDQFVEESETKKIDIDEFIQDLHALSVSGVDFRTEVDRFLEECEDERVKKMIMNIMEVAYGTE